MSKRRRKREEKRRKRKEEKERKEAERKKALGDAQKEKELQNKLMEEALKPADPIAPPQLSQTGGGESGGGTSMTTYYVIGGVGVLVLGLAAFLLLRKPSESSTK